MLSNLDFSSAIARQWFEKSNERKNALVSFVSVLWIYIKANERVYMKFGILRHVAKLWIWCVISAIGTFTLSADAKAQSLYERVSESFVTGDIILKLAGLGSDKRTIEVMLVQVNEDIFSAERIFLVLPSGETLDTARRPDSPTYPRAPGLWYGATASRSGDLYLLADKKGLIGDLYYKNRIYRIRPVGGGLHALMQLSKDSAIKSDDGALEPPEGRDV